MYQEFVRVTQFVQVTLSRRSYRVFLIHSALDRTLFHTFFFLVRSFAFRPLIPSRYVAAQFLFLRVSVNLSLSRSRTGPRGSPSNWFHSRGDRLSSRVRTGTTGIQSPLRCSVASTACRRRLSNVLSSDNYADEAVSYDNAAEDPVAFPVVAPISD